MKYSDRICYILGSMTIIRLFWESESILGRIIPLLVGIFTMWIIANGDRKIPNKEKNKK